MRPKSVYVFFVGLSSLVMTTLLAASPVLAIAVMPGPGRAIPPRSQITRNAGSGASPNKTAAVQPPNQATPLKTLQTRASAEINRRLHKLSQLSTLIADTKKLTVVDQSRLNGEVGMTISGLQSLQTKIAADTDLATAQADAKSIVTEYRVYTLVVPKVRLVAAADAQQQVEAKLTVFTGKLQTRIADARNQGKNVSMLARLLLEMNQQIADSRESSASVEHASLSLQPSDYNTEHTILSGYRNQLQGAHTDNAAAVSDATQIVQALKSF